MKIVRTALVVLIILEDVLLLNGCWNYREIDQLAVVAGVAIDKGVHDKYSITAEVVEISSEKESKTDSKLLTIEGKTIFDAVRHEITISGKRLYWSHAKIVVISKKIAQEGIIQVLDWFNRDAETRGDIHIIVSREETAKEILAAMKTTEDVKAFSLDDVLKNQKSLSKAPDMEIWKLANELSSKNVGAIASAVDLKQMDGEHVPHVMGTAIFDGEKLTGFIDGEETMALLFVRNEVKGGVLVETGQGDEVVALEIFHSKTKIEPVINNGKIEINVSIKTSVAIDEIGGTINVIDEDARKELEKAAEKTLRSRVESVIKKMQSEFGVDPFGFGVKLQEDNPKIWNRIAGQWKDQYKNLKVNVSTDIHIKNSAMLAKPLEVGA